MTPETAALLQDVVLRLERAVRERDCPAVVALQGERTLVLSDYDYSQSEATAQAFETRAADVARGMALDRLVFAVPQVWLVSGGVVAGRAISNLPLREGEQEVISWTSFDPHDGVDYGFVPYSRRPSGDPVFGDAEIFTAPVQAHDAQPGRVLLRSLLKAG